MAPAPCCWPPNAPNNPTDCAPGPCTSTLPAATTRPPWPRLELTRFGGHLILWEKGVHDAPTPRSVPTRVSTADGGSRPSGKNARRTVERIRALGPGDPQLGTPERSR